MSTNPYRLPRTVVPSNYQLHLTPDLVNYTFDGRVVIDAEVRESVTTFAVNALELEVGPATVTVDGQSFTSAAPTYSDQYQTATFVFDAALPTGPATIDISFTGTLNDQLHGFYRSTYTDDQGVTHTLATTQFESHDARRAFPCFDEPAMKAKFQLKVTDESVLCVPCVIVRCQGVFCAGCCGVRRLRLYVVLCPKQWLCTTAVCSCGVRRLRLYVVFCPKQWLCTAAVCSSCRLSLTRAD